MKTRFTVLSISLLLALFLVGWTNSANAAPKTCHGHNSACNSASITVAPDSTTVTANGCQANEYTQIQIDYFSTTTTGISVDGYTYANADGAVNDTFNFGSNNVAGYTGAHLTLTCGNLVLEAITH